MPIPYSGHISIYIPATYPIYTGSCDASCLCQRAMTDRNKCEDMAFFQLLKLLGARECTQTIIFLKQMNDKLTWEYFYAYTTKNYFKVGALVCCGSKTPCDKQIFVLRNPFLCIINYHACLACGGNFCTILITSICFHVYYQTDCDSLL